MRKIAVLVSGGVDSSVALAILKGQGHQVHAFYLKIWLEDELSFLGTCPWAADLAIIEETCKILNVPLQVISLQQEYYARVASLAITQIKEGLTPNPDVFCNSLIKFGAFFAHLEAQGFDFIATGHYARVVHGPVLSSLLTTPDLVKDQTYFLAKLTQSQLRKALFPIGNLRKENVRALAQKLNLPAQNRKDSQGLCFLGKIKFNDFIKENLGECEGSIIEYETGKILAKHQGYWFFTIGQRKGLGLSGGPFYVVKKDVVENAVFVSKYYFSAEKKRERFLVTDVNWLFGQTFKTSREQINLSVKLRHGPSFYDSVLTKPQGQNGKIMVQLLKARDQGISPGQFVVFYKKGICLGSGMITVDLDNPTRLG